MADIYLSTMSHTPFPCFVHPAHKRHPGAAPWNLACRWVFVDKSNVARVCAQAFSVSASFASAEVHISSIPAGFDELAIPMLLSAIFLAGDYDLLAIEGVNNLNMLPGGSESVSNLFVINPLIIQGVECAATFCEIHRHLISKMQWWETQLAQETRKSLKFMTLRRERAEASERPPIRKKPIVLRVISRLRGKD